MNPCKKAWMGHLGGGVSEGFGLREMKGGIPEWVPEPGLLGVSRSSLGG